MLSNGIELVFMAWTDPFDECKYLKNVQVTVDGVPLGLIDFVAVGTCIKGELFGSSLTDLSVKATCDTGGGIMEIYNSHNCESDKVITERLNFEVTGTKHCETAREKCSTAIFSGTHDSNTTQCTSNDLFPPRSFWLDRCYHEDVGFDRSRLVVCSGGNGQTSETTRFTFTNYDTLAACQNQGTNISIDDIKYMTEDCIPEWSGKGSDQVLIVCSPWARAPAPPSNVVRYIILMCVPESIKEAMIRKSLLFCHAVRIRGHASSKMR